MKKTALLLIVAFLFMASPVMAEKQVEPITTKYLYGVCMIGAFQDNNYCKTFILGAVNAHIILTSFYNFPSQYCLPVANVEKRMVGIFMKYAEENPVYFEKPAILTLFHAFQKAFPCPEPTPGK